MKFWQVDSFTDTPFRGNPAAVIVLEKDISDEQKQDIAMEMSVSETAFVVLSDQHPGIRWFTPNSEVKLCGHATLAASHVLWTEKFITSSKLEFHSKSGTLSVSRLDDGYCLDFPSQPPQEKPEYAKIVSAILGREAIYIGSNSEDCVAVIDDIDFLQNVSPDLEKIARLDERGFLLTAKDPSQAFDYIYRGFFPKLAIPEDPVTGSANTILAPYWAEQLKKNKLRAYQASKRGGELGLEFLDKRVLISGRAVTTIRGEILLGEKVVN